MHVRLCAVGLQWHKMNRKCPEHPSSSLLTTAVEEKQTSHRLLFLFFFGLFRPWYECVCDKFDKRECCDSCAGFFKWNFDHFLWATVSDVKKSVLTCGSRTRLTCRILIDLCSTVTVPVEATCISTRNCVKCEGIFINVWLPCRILLDIPEIWHIQINISYQTVQNATFWWIYCTLQVFHRFQVRCYEYWSKEL